MRLNKLAKPQIKKYENSGIIPNNALNLTKADASIVPSDAYSANKVGNNAKKVGGANSAAAIGGLASLGSSAIDIATMNDPEPSMGASVGKGALSGAATGAALGSAVPIVGTAIGAAGGALVGATMGYFQGKGEREAFDKEKKLKQEALDKQRNEQAVAMSQKALADVSNRGFTTSGNTQSSFYGKEGGRLKMLADGGIHIKPSHKGLFTAKATRAGEGVQEYASHVMANKEDFSPATVKQANFARNASHWKHGDGGKLVPNKTEMTKLSGGQEAAYQGWLRKNKYNESGDYDYRGYYKKEGFKNLGNPKGGEHFTDEFKRLSPFEGDYYMQLSDESNKASEFDKRGQGTWIGDKFVAYKQGGIIKKDGGELQPVSKNTQLAVGQSHENGGIKLDSKSEIEGGETLVNKGDHTLVVSDNLVNPLSGNTFAKDDLKLAKSLSKYEGKTSNLAKNSVRQINAKREILHSMQQKMNGDATDEEQNQNMAENGMKLNNIGVAGQGLTSEDITYKADIPIAGRPSPIRYAPKEVKKLNMISKPVQYPVPLRPQAPNYAENGMKMYKNGGEYTEDKKGNKSLVQKDGTYTQLSDGRTRYKAKGSNTWKDITDSKALYAIEDMEPKFKSDSNKNYDSFLQGKFNSNDLQGGKHYYKDAKSGKIIRVAKAGPNKDVEIELNDLEAKEIDKIYFGGKYFAPKPPNKDFTPSDPANLFGIKTKPPLRQSGFSKEDTSVNPTSPDKLPVPYKVSAFTMPDKKKAKLAKEEPRDYSSLKSGVSSLAKLGAYTAPALIDYANQQKNIARLKGIAIPEAPQQGFVNLAKQNMEVDRADIRKQQANYNAGLSGTIADSQTAALMKANVAEQSANALSRVNQAQRNANAQTANIQTEMNLGIDAKNRASKYVQEQQQMEKDVDISNRTADVKSKLMSDFRNVQNTYRQEKYADAALDVDLAGMSPEARAEFDRSTKARGHYGRYIVKNGGKLSNLTKSRI